MSEGAIAQKIFNFGHFMAIESSSKTVGNYQAIYLSSGELSSYLSIL